MKRRRKRGEDPAAEEEPAPQRAVAEEASPAAEPAPGVEAAPVTIDADHLRDHRALHLPEMLADRAENADVPGAPADSRIEPHERELMRRRRRRVMVAVSVVGLALLAFVTGLLLFNNLIMPQFIHSGSEVKVPDLANLTFEQAEKQVAAVHLQLSRAGERFDPSVPSGFILSQDPSEGTPVRGRKRVMVVVSLGEEYSSVPAVFGESIRGARLLIEHAGLTVGGSTRAPSAEVGEGLIAGSDPPAESVLPRGTAVGLLVSTGTGGELYMMPDLLGREIGGVRRQLEALGFRVLVPPSVPSLGTIVFQDPPPGSRITRDAAIMLQATGRMIR